MKIRELLDRGELPYNIGMVCTCTSPVCVEDYYGSLLSGVKYYESTSGHDEVYKIQMKVDSVHGRKTCDYNPSTQPGGLLTLFFGPHADIEFYNDKRDGTKYYRRGLRKLRKIFGREKINGLESF